MPFHRFINRFFILSLVIGLFSCATAFTQEKQSREIPSHDLIPVDQLYMFLKKDVQRQFGNNGIVSEHELAKYFRDKFSERFFYDWKTFDVRFKQYNEIYGNESYHIKRANDHRQKYADSTQWLLPFNYLNGEKVNAYALRHLARQHKMVDIAFQYFYLDRDESLIRYFVNQMHSLNQALLLGEYEKIEDGNGVYEAFRSGYRVLNWLSIHNMFLGEEGYSDQDQLNTIRTLLQHGAHLYKNNRNFLAGNHQTRGMSALAMLSILLRDFEGTELWFDRAMKILEQHLEKEINKDGFQFERSVHYHISDIANFFYVFQLCEISEIALNGVWKDKLYSLFTTLAKIAFPDKTAPVLQDDTDNPWAESNEISGAMTLGYLLFEDPEIGYFADKQVEDKMYWFLHNKQLKLFDSIKTKDPAYGSLMFPYTHYYIMREGWEKDDKMMIISAGLDSEKPDHQHGDMLGIQAMANGKVILPNYQVRYSLGDLELFKNSMVKNVALVDDELQGKRWTSNKGGSGFGKFKKLPKPNTIAWRSGDAIDFFAGAHDGFEDVGVSYSRQVVFVKNDFWIIKDNFYSNDKHTYKQIWQGHYTNEEGPNLIRASFENAEGLDIFQLEDVDRIESSGARGKQWTIVSKMNREDFQFITILYPYKRYNNRINENQKKPAFQNWKMDDIPFTAVGVQMRSLNKQNKSILFKVNQITIEGIQVEFMPEADLFVQIENNEVSIYSIDDSDLKFKINGKSINYLEDSLIQNMGSLKPGGLLKIQMK